MYMYMYILLTHVLCNLYTLQSPESSLSLGLILILMLVSCVLHEVLIWYIEAVFPGKYGAL